jgi:phenylpropionate dioxygenase-like ring-hydroxylating dioxygenase large terminal subunit
MTLDPTRWYPVAAADDLPIGHIYQTRLGGHPLAIWRGSSGSVNIWEDRCPHRGTRFSIGDVAGDTLRCQYHGWRFAAGSGACTTIPAQPDSKPAAAIRARLWPVAEQGGLIWTGLSPEGLPEALPPGEVLRAIPVWRDAATVEAALNIREGTIVFIQPVDVGRCVIRGVTDAGTLHATDAALERLRRTLEAAPC